MELRDPTRKDFTSHNLDHLGIIAATCLRIAMVETIDELVGDTKRKVSVGTAIMAMVLNAAGFVSRALYLTPEFFENIALEELLGPGIEPEHLDDDSLGDALDRLFEAGLTEVFFQVAQRALAAFDIDPIVGHLDSTTFSFHGNYEPDDDDDPCKVAITKGHSKDHRPDLEQLVVQLICSKNGRIPLWFEVLSGNSSDKKTFADTIQWFVENLQDEGVDDERLSAFVFIADSALYTRDNLKELDEQVTFVTRAPATIGAVKRLYAAGDIEQMTPCSDDERYHYQWHRSDYGGVEQRWLLVHSRPQHERADEKLDKDLDKEQEKAAKQLRKLSRRTFSCEADALEAFALVDKKCKYHRAVEPEVHADEKYASVGRPAKDAEPERIEYSVTGRVERDEEALEARRSLHGLIVLATNELDEERLDAEQLLRAYKGQNTTVERGFRFLEDPLFFADGLYLHKPSRVMAMLMVMTLALLVYSLAEHHLRTRLREEDETVPDQKGNPTQRLTMRRTFQMFEATHVLVLPPSAGGQRMVLNLEPVHEKILRLMGPEYARCYGLAEPPQMSGPGC